MIPWLYPNLTLKYCPEPFQYLREKISVAFRKRLRSILEGSGTPLTRMSQCQLSVYRLCTAFHLVEQHCQLDLSRSIREASLSEAFTEKMRDLHQLDVQTNNGAPAVAGIVESLVGQAALDKRGEGVFFSPLQGAFLVSRGEERGGNGGEFGGNSGESWGIVLDGKDLGGFVEVFGSYGVDCLSGEVREILGTMMTRFEKILRANRAPLAELAERLHDKDHRNAALDSLEDAELAGAICVQIGVCLNLLKQLGKTAARKMTENVPLVLSTLSAMARYAPRGTPENCHVAQIRRLASRFGVLESSPEVLSLLLEIGGVGDSCWALLPHFLASLLASDLLWKGSGFSLSSGGFHNNIHCLSR